MNELWYRKDVRQYRRLAISNVVSIGNPLFVSRIEELDEVGIVDRKQWLVAVVRCLNKSGVSRVERAAQHIGAVGFFVARLSDTDEYTRLSEMQIGVCAPHARDCEFGHGPRRYRFADECSSPAKEAS